VDATVGKWRDAGGRKRLPVRALLRRDYPAIGLIRDDRVRNGRHTVDVDHCRIAGAARYGAAAGKRRRLARLGRFGFGTGAGHIGIVVDEMAGLL
jgi:hypothetical protein